MSSGTRYWWKAGRSGRSRGSWGYRGSRSGSTWTRRRRRARRRRRGARPVWDGGGRAIEALLAESMRWTGGKQRLTATRLHQLLRRRAIASASPSSSTAVAEWKRQRREVFVPLTYRPGELAEVDFFEVLVDVAGERRRRGSSAAADVSGRDFAWIYQRQDQVSSGRARARLRALGRARAGRPTIMCRAT